MSNSFDAVIIGAGIIGAATALALARAGRKVLAVEKLPASGYGSTGASCAIIRPYYSTVDGSALAYESHFSWRDWAEFLGVDSASCRARSAMPTVSMSSSLTRAATPSGRRS